MPEISLVKDKDWSRIDSEPCKVITFTPLAIMKDGNVLCNSRNAPYASVTLECKKYPKKITGYIHHKTDFINLWSAFKERGIKQDEEVMIFWSKKHYKSYAKIFAAFMPKLWITIRPIHTF